MSCSSAFYFLDPGFTHPRVQFGWQSWQTELASAYFQTRVSFSPSTPAGQVFTQCGPSIKWAHFMQWSGPCRETKKQLVCDVLMLVYSEGNAEDKSTCIRLQQVFGIFVVLLHCYLKRFQVFALVGWTVRKAVPDV